MMKREPNYLLLLLMISLLVAAPGELLAGKKSSSRQKISSVYDKDFDFEVYLRAPEGSWYVDLGHRKGDPEQWYAGPFTLKEAQKLVMMAGEIPIVWDDLPFRHPLTPNIVSWVYVVTLDTFAEVQEVMQFLDRFEVQMKYRRVPAAGWRRN